jgi:hypothetical protein
MGCAHRYIGNPIAVEIAQRSHRLAAGGALGYVELDAFRGAERAVLGSEADPNRSAVTVVLGSPDHPVFVAVAIEIAEDGDRAPCWTVDSVRGQRDTRKSPRVLGRGRRRVRELVPEIQHRFAHEVPCQR